MAKRVRASAPVRQRANYTHTVGIDVDRDVLVVAHYRSNAPYAAIDEFPNSPQGHAALVTCLTGGDAPQAYYRSLRGRMGHSKALLAVCHIMAEGWYNCTKLQVAWSPLRALSRRTGMPVYVNQETGEVKL